MANATQSEADGLRTEISQLLTILKQTSDELDEEYFKYYQKLYNQKCAIKNQIFRTICKQINDCQLRLNIIENNNANGIIRPQIQGQNEDGNIEGKEESTPERPTSSRQSNGMIPTQRNLIQRLNDIKLNVPEPLLTPAASTSTSNAGESNVRIQVEQNEPDSVMPRLIPDLSTSTSYRRRSPSMEILNNQHKQPSVKLCNN